jgi:hypothetical protein
VSGSNVSMQSDLSMLGIELTILSAGAMLIFSV